MSEPPHQNEDPPPALTGRQTYNVVADTVAGANVRLKDNLVQGIAIFVCLGLGAGIGAAVVEERAFGAMGGGFWGLLIGLFGSGRFLKVYRLVMHLRGRHDCGLSQPKR